jgi:integrase
MKERRENRRGANPAATNLWRDPRTGVYVWRRTHALTGRRFRRSTGSKIRKIALARAQQFEEEHQREVAGLSKFEGYRRPLDGFLEPFLESLSCGPRRQVQVESQLRRAFRLLGLDLLADLEDFTKIEAKLLRLNGKNGFTPTTIAVCFQAPLKQLSRYLAGRREILADHLAAWPALKRSPPKRKRRAILPDEMARILAASDCLDAMWPRRSPMRPVWTALLVAAPRVSALAALDVGDLDREHRRLLLKGNDTKRAGAGALDEGTLAEISDYIGDRTEGPLFLSPERRRIDTENSLRRFRLAASLAFVDMEWPEDEERDLRLLYLVHHALHAGRVVAAMGGPLSGPNAPGQEKRSARKKRAQRVKAIAAAIRPAWEEHMRGDGHVIDQHCMRMTHRTWALAAGVPEILVDRQLGHSSPAGEAALHAAWSAVGRKHYTDMGFLTVDARRSAEAVRGVLARAEDELQDASQRGETALLRTDRPLSRAASGSGR